MRSVYSVAGVISLSLTMPVLAKPDGNGKGQAKREHIGGNQKSSKSVANERTRARAADRFQRTRSDRDGDGILDRNERHARGGQACPPGLAKKHNGCLPPGQAKKRFAIGERLPSSFNSYNVPEQYRDQYRDTNEDLFRYNDGSLYRVDARTRLIEEVIRLIGR